MAPRASCQAEHHASTAGRKSYTDTVLKSHKRAIADIKSAQQRVRKATEERDKLKEKLKKAQVRLAIEQERLRRSQENLES
jgi:hypothetical protein